MTVDGVRRVVIVGGGIAGFAAATELRRLGYSESLTLIDSGAEPYDRPPLTKEYLFGGVSRHEIRLARPGWFADNDVGLLLQTRVQRLDPSGGSVVLADGSELRADAVILATGGQPRGLPVPGGDGPFVHVLRTIEDADRLKASIEPGTRLLVVGAGLIGAEVASSALRLGAEVTLIDPTRAPLLAAVGPEVAAYLHGQHVEHGIASIEGSITALAAREPDGPVIASLASGETLETDIVLAGIGIVPDTELAASAGLSIDGGVLVDRAQRTSNPRIFAAGDGSRTRNPDGVLERRAEHWDAAGIGGRAAAAGLLGVEPAAPTASWFWTDRHGVHVEATGEMNGSGTTVIRGEIGAGPFAAFRVADGRVLGAVAVDDSNAIRAARRLIDAGVPVNAEELADPDVNLRRLLRAEAARSADPRSAVRNNVPAA